MEFWSKVIVHEIRGTNFWDTLYLQTLSSKTCQVSNPFKWINVSPSKRIPKAVWSFSIFTLI